MQRPHVVPLIIVLLLILTSCKISEDENNAPIAQAGSDHSISLGESGVLNGQLSSDEDGDELTYQWTLVSRPLIDNSELLNSTSAQPQLTPETVGTYLLQLVVNDGIENSLPSHITITVVTPNIRPVADAGQNIIIQTPSLINLDGSLSTDSNEDELFYAWTFTAIPANSNSVLLNASTIKPNFTPDVAGEYVIALVVNDRVLASISDSVHILLEPSYAEQNIAPVANTGGDQNVLTQTRVILNANNSYDLNSDSLTYVWFFQTRPAQSTAQLFDANSIITTFIADKEGNYVIQLTVNDGIVGSTIDIVTIVSSIQNHAPVANAGVSRSVYVSQQVQLSGESSSDADNDTLMYAWSITSVPDGSQVTSLNNATSETPTFTPDVAGSYVMSLTVNDGQLSSTADSVTITSTIENRTPVANAGTDQDAYVSQQVQLSGANSSDADNDALTYAWTITSVPNDSQVTSLSNAAIVNPTFTPDVAGSYVISLTVNDGQLSSTADSVTITSTIENRAPVANAGTDQGVFVSQQVQLSGVGSSDADNDTLTYAWTITSVPNDSQVTSLSSATLVNPTFTADVAGSYVMSLTVSDGQLSSVADSITVTSSQENNAPTADAGAYQAVTTLQNVQLDGSGSRDIDNDTLTYTWSFQTKPAGSAVSLTNTQIVNPSFAPDIDGDYIIQLIVNDGETDSSASLITVSSSTGNTVSDDFAGNGELTGYTINNESSLPGVTRKDGRYHALVDNNDNEKTLHFNGYQGRLDAKLVQFPFDYIARNIGLGTVDDSQTPASAEGNLYLFAGIQVHVTDLDSINSSHIVVGHRGSADFTVEGKNTLNGRSSVRDVSQFHPNAAPNARADIRVQGNADRTLTISWQLPNLSGDSSQDNWVLYKDHAANTTGSLPGTAPIYGTSVYIGLITYTQGSHALPFVGSCDAIEFTQL